MNSSQSSHREIPRCARDFGCGLPSRSLTLAFLTPAKRLTFPVLSSQKESDRQDLRRAMSRRLSRPSTGRQTFFRWLKFNFVGGIGIGVQLAVLAILRSLLHFDYLLATAVAVEAAVLHNFLWHERFTWADRGSVGQAQRVVRLAKFNLSNGAVSLVGNILLMRLLMGEFGVNYMAANLVAIAFCSLANFLLSDRFVFGVSPLERGSYFCR